MVQVIKENALSLLDHPDHLDTLDYLGTTTFTASATHANSRGPDIA